jgi:hypothetical protein
MPDKISIEATLWELCELLDGLEWRIKAHLLELLDQAKPGEYPHHTKECGWCSRVFKAEHPKEIFCDDACRESYYEETVH